MVVTRVPVELDYNCEINTSLIIILVVVCRSYTIIPINGTTPYNAIILINEINHFISLNGAPSGFS